MGGGWWRVKQEEWSEQHRRPGALFGEVARGVASVDARAPASESWRIHPEEGKEAFFLRSARCLRLVGVGVCGSEVWVMEGL